MSSRRPQKTLADYLVVAISPLLIMALVGSLVFFLLEVVYRGPHAGRLRWVPFWFVFATVLIARIAIEQGKAAARVYAVAFWAAVIVVAAIVWSGVELFRNSASELLDVQAGGEFVERVREAAASVDGVRGVETLWVRKSGLEYFADIHIEVDPSLTAAEGHRIGHRVKDHLLESFPALRDVLVHLEPYPHTHEDG